MKKIILCLLPLLVACKLPWSGSTDTLKVINVLSEPYYRDAHIKGSINIEFDQLLEKTKSWPKNSKIVLYCANYQCTASGEGVRQLRAEGFTDVMAYEGGTAEWYQLGRSDARYVTEGPAQQAYLTMALNRPEGHEADVPEISAEELLKLLES